MADPRFYARAGPFSLGDLARTLGATLSEPAAAARRVDDVGPLESIEPGGLSYVTEARFLPALKEKSPAASLVPEALAAQAAGSVPLLIVAEPAAAYAAAVRLFYPTLGRPPGAPATAALDPTAEIEAGVSIGPGAVIGAGASIGARTVIGALSVIGPGTAIGRDCWIGAGTTLAYSLLGDRVILHPGVRLGADGFGYAPGSAGLVKIPQLGRVILQDDVEVGANTTIDRGSGPDTVIGQGTKIDNLVQIGHNVRIGRGCIIAAQCGVAGSTVIEDFVMIGGQVGINDHVTIGARAQIAACAAVMRDVPPGGIYCGVPAKPIRVFMREVATLSRLAKVKGRGDE